MDKIFELKRSLIIKNSFLNLIGQAVPLITGIVVFPFVVHRLGTERFGLLSLVWVVLGYFTIFDLGLGRATTKYVAEALGKGDMERIPRIIWTTVTIQIILGIMGIAILILLIPFLTEQLLKIPSSLITEAKSVFYILALTIPIILLSSSLSGVLEAFQRFDLVNAVKIPSGSFNFLSPLIGVFLGFNLAGIVMIILIVRILTLLVLILLNIRVSPKIKKFSPSFQLFPRLFSFGLWVTLTSILSPTLIYLDRLLIGSLISLEALAFYAAPYEVVSRLGIIPNSLTLTLFPAFSFLESIKDKRKLSFYFGHSIRYVLLTLGPVTLFINSFAREILQLWLGENFAQQSAIILKILTISIFINSFAYIPFVLLQGIGRSDLPAKFHLLELPLYLAVAFFLIGRWGIKGAAVAWTFRIILDALLLFLASFKICQFPKKFLGLDHLIQAGLSFSLLILISLSLKGLADSLTLPFQLLLFTLPFGIFIGYWFNREIKLLTRKEELSEL